MDRKNSSEVSTQEEIVREPGVYSTEMRYKGISHKKLEESFVEAGFRLGSQKTRDAIAIAGWIEQKLRRTSRLEAKEVVYEKDLGGSIYTGSLLSYTQIIRLQDSALMEDLKITASRAKAGKKVLSASGFIGFYKTLPRSEKFAKLWKVDLEPFGEPHPGEEHLFGLTANAK